MSWAFWGSDPALTIPLLGSMVPRCCVGQPLPTELGALCFWLPVYTCSKNSGFEPSLLTP